AAASGAGSGGAVGPVDGGGPRRRRGAPSRSSVCGVGQLYWPWQPPRGRCEGPFLPSIAPGRLLSPEPEKTARIELKRRGIKKRVACLALAMPASRLYELLSNYYVHGGSLANLIHSSPDPTQYSCWFHNRIDPEKLEIGLLTRGVEMLCVEISN